MVLLGADGHGLSEEEEPHLGGGSAQHALAEQRVGLDAAQTPALEALRRGPARLVVHDDETPVGRDVQAVDDATEAHAVDDGLDTDFDADGVHRVRVLEPVVVVQQPPRVGQEGCLVLVGEAQFGVLVVVETTRPHPFQLGVGCRARPFAGRVPPEEAFERGMDEGALHGVRRRGFGPPLDLGVPERERATRERADLGGREGPRQVECHVRQDTTALRAHR